MNHLCRQIVMKRYYDALLLVLLIAAMPGCGKLWTREMSNYNTVSIDPSHDYEKAKKENEKALKFLADGKLDKAEQALQRALVADVNYGPAHNNLGQLYFNQSKYYLAAVEFDFAVKLMPDRAEPANNLGLVYEKVGKLNEAVESYEIAMRLQPNNAEIIGNLVRARLRRGDPFSDVEKLLRDLIVFDTRPEWVDWAKHQIEVVNKSAQPLTSLEIIQTPSGEHKAPATDSPRILDERSIPSEPVRNIDTDRVTRTLIKEPEKK